MRTVMGLVKERWEVREEELEGVGKVEGGHINSGINSLTGKERAKSPQTGFGSVTLAGRYVPGDLDSGKCGGGGGGKRRRLGTGSSVDLTDEEGEDKGDSETRLGDLFKKEKSERKVLGGKANLTVVLDPLQRMGGRPGPQKSSASSSNNPGLQEKEEEQVEDRWEEGGEEDYQKNYDLSDEEDEGGDGEAVY
ncbi:hypothetical protein TrRE_jg7135 [Triparma retinervis]|uniref:Uncharacterized protein n=1 Tax=Triparma retinervis TaxID=2557542 RepID=A0A9W7G439_9STRA|nr:hypothetical protein TrRE_jg7135 [Triparma retinervis]